MNAPEGPAAPESGTCDPEITFDPVGALMTDFYVSWMKPIERARIHKADYRDCNHGQGQLGQDKTGSGNSGWIEAETMERAVEIATNFTR